MRKEGMEWFIKGENKDYFAEEIIAVSSKEQEAWTSTAQRCFNALTQTARNVIQDQQWANLGIPENARRLVEYSLANELDDFLLGRFDFAGGFSDFSIKMLEFNADTCSLIPETAHVQRHLWVNMKKGIGEGPFDPLLTALTDRFKRLLEQHPDREPNILLSSMGYEEDCINIDVLVEAARKAGFEEIYQVNLEAVIFDPEEGVFLEIGQDRFIHFDFWYKIVPWDFIANEEPDLMNLLTDLVIEGKLLVLNPAWTMLLQSKASLVMAHEQHLHENAILKAAFSAASFPEGKYAQKPIFGRTGENVSLFDGRRSQAIAQNDGDYGDMPAIYQELASFSTDTEGYRYQASVFYTDHPCALCFRRQDDLIIDDDAEFIAHTISDDV